MCDIDGQAFSGVVVSATEPSQQGKWLDISGDNPVLREWEVSSSMWTVISATYLRVGPLEFPRVCRELQAHDTVLIEPEDLVSEEIAKVIGGWHYLYNVLHEADGLYIVISGIMDDLHAEEDQGRIDAYNRLPTMDFVVEAGNRLWGCRYSEEDGINEIYASALGDPANWHVYQGLSTDSWTASRGTAAPFTGAAVLNGCPLFFRAESLEKVFPSASGAHQIATYDLEGVQERSADSLVVIEDRLYYKSRQGVMLFGGTMPQRISPQFGEWLFSGATAARHGRRYCISMTRSDGVRMCMVYDLATGDWHVEDEAWEGKAITWEDRLYYIEDGQLLVMDGTDSSDGVSWWAETQPITHDLPEHRWISYLRLRFRLETGASCRVLISYDDGPWIPKGALRGNLLHTQELGIWPMRCDHFRLRLEGTGGCELYSVSYRMERSEGGH